MTKDWPKTIGGQWTLLVRERNQNCHSISVSAPVSSGTATFGGGGEGAARRYQNERWPLNQ